MASAAAVDSKLLPSPAALDGVRASLGALRMASGGRSREELSALSKAELVELVLELVHHHHHLVVKLLPVLLRHLQFALLKGYLVNLPH